jgi:hypothetical protein
MRQLEFYASVDLIFLTKKKAKNLAELLEGIKTLPGSGIFYHTHRFLQQHNYLSPEPPNDFAYWTTNVLLERIIGERLASIDIISFHTIMDLKEKLISIIEDYLKDVKDLRNAPEGMEFHFMLSKSFVLKTGYVAHDLKEFYEIIKKISIHSLYFHIFLSRLRLEKGDNDFSIWLREELHEEELAFNISRLDPYTWTLEGLRSKICSLIEERLYDKN